MRTIESSKSLAHWCAWCAWWAWGLVPLRTGVLCWFGCILFLIAPSTALAQRSPDYTDSNLDIYDERDGENTWTVEYSFADLSTAFNAITAVGSQPRYSLPQNLVLMRRGSSHVAFGIAVRNTIFDLSFASKTIYDTFVVQSIVSSISEEDGTEQEVKEVLELALVTEDSFDSILLRLPTISLPLRYTFKPRPLHDTTFYVEYRSGLAFNGSLVVDSDISTSPLETVLANPDQFGVSDGTATLAEKVLPQLASISSISSNLYLRQSQLIPIVGLSFGYRRRVFNEFFIGSNFIADAVFLSNSSLETNLPGSPLPPGTLKIPLVNFSIFAAYAF